MTNVVLKWWLALSLSAAATMMLVMHLPTGANAWWCLGHMTVAEIAKQFLSDKTLLMLENVTSHLSAQGPFPLSPDFVQTACWADDIRTSTQGLVSMTSWHFVDTPYNPENVPIPVIPQEENVESVIAQLERALDRQRQRGGRGGGGSGGDSSSRGGNQWVVAFSVALLIHFMGDIHQPLHATSFFSPMYPRGDAGGNDIAIVVDGKASELHAFWDSICWSNAGVNEGPDRPLKQSGRFRLDGFVFDLINTYGPVLSEEEKHTVNSTVMAEESYHIAETVVYRGITNGTTITQEYTNRCLPVAHRRLALAGYRLGYALETFFGGGYDKDMKDHVESAKKVLRHVAKGRVSSHSPAALHQTASWMQQNKKAKSARQEEKQEEVAPPPPPPQQRRWLPHHHEIPLAAQPPRPQQASMHASSNNQNHA